MSKIKRIYFSGLDGSGKSTITKKLAKKLEKDGLKVAKLHFYYNYSFLKILRLLKSKKDTPQEIVMRDMPKRDNSLKNKLWSYFIVLDACFQLLLFEIFHFNQVKIYDRFFQDYLVSFQYLNLKPNFLLKLISKIKLKNHFLILAEPKTAFQRTPEHSPEFFQECYKYYLDLEKKYNLKHINTTNLSPEQSLDLVLQGLNI